MRYYQFYVYDFCCAYKKCGVRRVYDDFDIAFDALFRKRPLWG